MPLYEYACDADGTVIELMRPADRADDPVEDPEGKGRRFVRRLSTFAAQSGKTGAAGLPIRGCPCGDPNGPCSN